MATEKRLIDANTLETKMGGLCDEFGTDHLFIDAIVYEICNATTVDAVEVVRCKECRCDGGCSIQDAMNWTPRENIGDWFCSYGERRAHEKI